MNFNNLIEDALISKGASIVGFADLSDIDINARRGFRYGILIGIAVDSDLVSNIPNGPTIAYKDEIININKTLNSLCDFTVDLIAQNGFNAFSQGNIKQDDNFRTPLPHKTVATRAGIGWIGKSGTLVTEEYGNCIRIHSVLTDMNFITGTPINESKCGNCNLCTDNCPGKAVKGVNWNIKIDRDELLDARACKQEVIRRGIPLDITVGSCGICLAVCPYTKKYLKRD